METYLLLYTVLTLFAVHFGLTIFTIVQLRRVKSEKKIRYSPPEGMTAPEVGYWAKENYSDMKGKRNVRSLQDGIWESAILDAAINKYITLTVTADKEFPSKSVFQLDRLPDLSGNRKPHEYFDAIAAKCPINTRKDEHAFTKLEEKLKGFLGSDQAQDKYVNSYNYLVLTTLPLWLILTACSLWGAIAYTSTESHICILALFLSFVMTTFIFTRSSPYNVSGQIMRNQIEGFRMYLNATKEERKAFVDAPKMTFELYEKYLPYVAALDVMPRLFVTYNWYQAMCEGIGKGKEVSPIIRFPDQHIMNAASFPQASLGIIGYDESYYAKLQGYVHTATSKLPDLSYTKNSGSSSIGSRYSSNSSSVADDISDLMDFASDSSDEGSDDDD